MRVSGVLLSKSRDAAIIVTDLFKIRQSMLLIFTGLFGYLIASGASADLLTLIKLLVALALTIFGTTGINMVLDSDIDSIMARTKRRVIPRGMISKGVAAILSMAFLIPGLVISYTINMWVFIAGILGFLIDIGIYTVLTKRRSWTSVIYGGFAGGMPAFGGYMAYTGYPSPEALILLTLVALWSNAHIWYIVIYNYDDYKKAGIPMLPIVKGVRAGVMGSIIHVILMLILIIAYFVLTGNRSWLTLIIGAALSIKLLMVMRRHLEKVDRIEAYKTFKILSPYLSIIFILMLIDRLVFL
ncbi:MAG: protoheme IX farnesyltransferase [Sulfolobales archaeon]